MRLCLLLIAFAAAAIPALSAPFSSDRPFPAHRIADHLYYVGSEQLASYLVTTPQGHILINTSMGRTVPFIQSSVEKLGFRLTDIRILLISHAHFDHCESLATMRAKTGAKIYVMQGDEDVVASGGKGAIQTDEHFPPAHVDRVLHDGDHVDLGGISLVAHLTPGHTKGCTTWTMVAQDRGKNYNVVIVGSPNLNSDYRLFRNTRYPGIAQDYARGFAVLHSLPCDIFLGAHGSYYGMDEKYARLKSSGENPFIDPAGYKEYIDSREKAFKQVLDEQSRKE